MGSATQGTVFTTGYEGKTQAQLREELASYQIEQVVDIRAIAESSVDGFSGPELAQALTEDGITYHHLGELGDFQPTPYPDYMQTDDWRQAYDQLETLLDGPTTCLLCICADVSACHRRFMARQLREDGYKVVHLTPAGPTETVTFEGS